MPPAASAKWLLNSSSVSYRSAWSASLSTISTNSSTAPSGIAEWINSPSAGGSNRHFPGNLRGIGQREPLLPRRLRMSPAADGSERMLAGASSFASKIRVGSGRRPVARETRADLGPNCQPVVLVEHEAVARLPVEGAGYQLVFHVALNGEL